MSRAWEKVKAAYFWYEDKIDGYPHLVAIIWPVSLILAAWFF